MKPMYLAFLRVIKINTKIIFEISKKIPFLEKS